MNCRVCLEPQNCDCLCKICETARDWAFVESLICKRCINPEEAENAGGFSLSSGEFVCEEHLTDDEKVELGNYWRKLEGKE
jgi:hypothetical protein